MIVASTGVSSLSPRKFLRGLLKLAQRLRRRRLAQPQDAVGMANFKRPGERFCRETQDQRRGFGGSSSSRGPERGRAFSSERR